MFPGACAKPGSVSICEELCVALGNLGQSWIHIFSSTAAMAQVLSFLGLPLWLPEEEAEHRGVLASGRPAGSSVCMSCLMPPPLAELTAL